MAKVKKPAIEIELFSGYSVQSAGLEIRDEPDKRIEENEEERHAHAERLLVFAEFVANTRSLSEEVIFDRTSHNRVDESRHHFDWSVITNHYEIFRLMLPSSAVAIAAISSTSKYFVAVVKAGGATIKVGKKSIHVDNVADIDKALAAVAAFAEATNPEAPAKAKKPAATKKFQESPKPKKRK